MPDNEKKNGVLSALKGVFKGKKEQYADIETQAEKVITDYINKRRNEIINKYSGKKSPLLTVLVVLVSGFVLYMAYTLLS